MVKRPAFSYLEIGRHWLFLHFCFLPVLAGYFSLSERSENVEHELPHFRPQNWITKSFGFWLFSFLGHSYTYAFCSWGFRHFGEFKHNFNLVMHSNVRALSVDSLHLKSNLINYFNFLNEIDLFLKFTLANLVSTIISNMKKFSYSALHNQKSIFIWDFHIYIQEFSEHFQIFGNL